MPACEPPDIVAIARTLAATLFRLAEKADAAGAVSDEALLAVQRSGVLEAPLPASHGGADLAAPEHHGALLDVLRLLGGADLNWARLIEGHVNGVLLMQRYGTDAQRDELAGHICDGALTGVWGANDEKGLRLVPTGDGFVLRGRKILASGAGLVTQPLVTADDPRQPLLLHLKLKRGERADLSAWTPQGMRSSATGAIGLDGLTLQADRVVGLPGDFLRQPTLSGGAWRFCAAHLGAAERLVDLYRQHLAASRRGEDPYQLQRIAQCVAAVTTAGYWVRDAARLAADRTADPVDVVAHVNLTRSVTERAALDVVETVHRGVGLASFMRPNAIERVSRDLSTYLRQPVPDLAMADGARAVLASARPTGDLWR